MFGIGMPELIIILVIALIVIGPKKLPDLAKALGKGLSEFKKATTEIKDGLNLDEDFKEAREDLADAVSGLDKPSDLKKKEAAVEDVAEKEKPPKFDDYDQMLDAYHQEREKPSENTTIATASQEVEEKTEAPATVEKDRNG
ncbi:putative twin arginine-targeting protein translocase TatB [delta proteobacterium NaphS2]|nr:putative twin arginine-targeting protein translocase TatB [delta proteobacterium NaphS2]